MSDSDRATSTDATLGGPLGLQTIGEISPDPIRAFRRAVAEFEEATSSELMAQSRLHRLAWAAFFSVPLGFLGSNLILLGIANSSSSGNGTLSSVLIALGVALCGAVAGILLLTFIRSPWRGVGRPVSSRTATDSIGSQVGLQSATEELVRIQVEVDRMRRRASDTVLLIAILLFFLGGLASSLVSAVFPGLSWGSALILSYAAFGTAAILWAVLYWRATLRRTRRMESRAHALTEGLAQLERALWSRF